MFARAFRFRRTRPVRWHQGWGVAALLMTGGNVLAYDGTPAFAMPMQCTVGVDCWIAKYMDHDPAAREMRDYACGRLAGDGHTGVDIAIRDGKAMAAGVTVVAAASGRVGRVREGVSDQDVRTTGPAVEGRSCGNGVLVDHGEGWQSLYCHLRRGSIVVQPGQTVKTGDPLGRVGLSGETEYPHLHFDVLKNGKRIDPFVGLADEAPAACGRGATPLWTEEVAAQLAYQPFALYNVGFAPGKPERSAVRSGAYRIDPFPATAEVMFLWAEMFGSKAGDEIRFRLTGPDGTVQEETGRFDTPALQRIPELRLPRPGARWPSGRYTLTITALRPGIPAQTSTASVAVP
ncbi:MAG: Peptidase M23B family protein [Rhodospirillaceae bacterium]|nr:MAG: Peptidase M23B family protein [Rhodospirillaceae bacterium]